MTTPAQSDRLYMLAVVLALETFRDHLWSLVIQRGAEWIAWLETWAPRQAEAEEHDRECKRLKATDPTAAKALNPKLYREGDVYMVDLGVGLHVEASYPHPCVILHNNWHTVLVAPMTHTERSGGLLVPSKLNGEDGTILGDQIKTISKYRIRNRIGTLKGRPEFQQLKSEMLGAYFEETVKAMDDLKKQIADKEEEIVRLKKANAKQVRRNGRLAKAYKALKASVMASAPGNESARDA